MCATIGPTRASHLDVDLPEDSVHRRHERDSDEAHDEPHDDDDGRDEDRKQSFDEALATYDAMVRAYSEQGYELTPLPKASVVERTRFVMDWIG